MGSEITPALLTLAQAAIHLGICEKTLRGYMHRGEIKHIAFGHGLQRQRRRFHPDDLAAFMDQQRRTIPCQSTEQRTKPGTTRRPSTTTTSKSDVVGFMARRTAALNEMRNEKSRGNG